MGTPSRLRLIRKTSALARMVPTLDLSIEEEELVFIITGKARAKENTYKWVSV